MSDESTTPSGSRGRLGDGETPDGRDDAYTVRGFRPEDRDAYIAMHRRTFESETSPEWFAWKYERNPFVDEVPVTVAEHDGEVVGAVSGFPLRMNVGGESVVAYVTCEGFVHPDHRRRGVFTRMVRASWRRHVEKGMAFVFGLTGNEKTLSAHVKHNDWRPLGTLPRYYRFRRPGELLADETGSRLLAAVGRAAGPALGGYYRVRRGLGAAGAADVDVDRYDEAPADLLASIYREGVPETFHAVRDERLYGWRFENPNRKYVTYVAVRGGAPRAAIVVARNARRGVVEARIVDALPLDPGAAEEELTALLGAAIEDHPDACLVNVLPGVLPERALSTFGFVRQDRFPLSRVTRPIYPGVRAFEETADRLAVPIDELYDPDNWNLNYVEHDGS